jgi:hypothetical protein
LFEGLDKVERRLASAEARLVTVAVVALDMHCLYVTDTPKLGQRRSRARVSFPSRLLYTQIHAEWSRIRRLQSREAADRKGGRLSNLFHHSEDYLRAFKLFGHKKHVPEGKLGEKFNHVSY